MKITGGIFFILLYLPFVCSAGEHRIASMFGLGNESCGSFTESLRQVSFTEGCKCGDMLYPSPSRAYSEWLFGYITAFNMFNSQKKNISDVDRAGVIYWIVDWCQKHATDTVKSAAWNFVLNESDFDLEQYE